MAKLSTYIAEDECSEAKITTILPTLKVLCKHISFLVWATQHLWCGLCQNPLQSYKGTMLFSRLQFQKNTTELGIRCCLQRPASEGPKKEPRSFPDPAVSIPFARCRVVPFSYQSYHSPKNHMFADLDRLADFS